MSNPLLIIAILPTIVLGWFIYKKDKFGKESYALLIKLFIGGIGATILTLIISAVLEGFFPVLKNSSYKNETELVLGIFGSVALVEEFSKWYFLKKITWKNKEFDHIYDAIVYAVFASLGFATLENIMYVITYNSLQTAIIRALVSVPGHVFDAIIMGTFYGEARKKKLDKKYNAMCINLILSILMPALAHGFFDYLLFLGTSKATIIFYVYVGILYIVSFITVNKVAKIQYNFEDLICPNCGNVSKEDFCTSCGNRLK